MKTRIDWLGGLANEKGFGLIDFKNGIRVQTSNFSWSFYHYLIILDRWISLFFALLCLGSFYWYLLNFSPAALIIFGIVSLFLVARLVWGLISACFFKEEIDPQLEEWHACEHKLVNLLAEKKELTLDNLKRASFFGSYCGSENRYLAEPSSEKLEETLRVGKQYYQKLNQRRRD
jgi:hypothetical protein